MARFLESLYVNGAGTQAASGFVNFYQVGTLTPAVIYSRDDLTQPVTQPIVLDANGRTPLPLYTATPLRCIIQNSQGATLQDIERIDGDRAELVGVSNADWPGVTDLNSLLSLLRTSLGGPNGTFLDPGVGGISRLIVAKFEEIQVSVKDFGALGNNLTDDTTAIQAAINRTILLGGGVIYFPPGIYLISAALTTGTPAVAIGFRGAGLGASTIKQTAAAANSLNISANLTAVAITDMSISATASTGTGVQIAAGATLAILAITNLKVSGHASGITGISPSSQARTAVLTNIVVDVTAASAGAGLSGSFENTTIIGAAINGSAASTTCTNILLTAGVGGQLGGTFVGIFSYLGLFGLDIPAVATLGTLTLTGCVFSSSPVRLNAASTLRLFNLGSDLTGTVTDARTGAPVATALSGTGSASPQFNIPMRIIQNTAATTVTVNVPSTGVAGSFIEVMCLNNSGGAVTWTFAAGYKTSGAVAPASGSFTTVRFTLDHISNSLREVARATAVI